MRAARAAEVASDLVEHLVVLASRWTGVSPDSVHPENVRRVASALLARGLTATDLVAGAESGDPAIVESLRTAVSIGETYFFRSPDQFQLVEKLLRARGPAPPGVPFRAWSAGCATGEEAYSIASLLHQLWPATTPRPEVLGTDHLAAHVETARLGLYRPWSMRESAPIPYPLFRDQGEGGMSIRDELRALTRFAVHNLLAPPPAEAFDLVFCRNVFIYYDPPTVARLIERLTAALAPQGILVLGVADPVIPPPGMQPAGPPELRVYTRATVRASTRPAAPVALPSPPVTVVHQPPSRPPAGTSPAPVDPVALHVEALHLIERGDRRQAETLLAEIRRIAPDYLAARMEQALLHRRFGQQALARAQLGEILTLLASASDDQVLPGPEPLPVSYYRAAAQALLGGPSNRGA